MRSLLRRSKMRRTKVNVANSHVITDSPLFCAKILARPVAILFLIGENANHDGRWMMEWAGSRRE